MDDCIGACRPTMEPPLSVFRHPGERQHPRQAGKALGFRQQLYRTNIDVLRGFRLATMGRRSWAPAFARMTRGKCERDRRHLRRCHLPSRQPRMGRCAREGAPWTAKLGKREPPAIMARDRDVSKEPCRERHRNRPRCPYQVSQTDDKISKVNGPLFSIENPKNRKPQESKTPRIENPKNRKPEHRSTRSPASIVLTRTFVVRLGVRFCPLAPVPSRDQRAEALNPTRSTALRSSLLGRSLLGNLLSGDFLLCSGLSHGISLSEKRSSDFEQVNYALFLFRC